MSEEKKLTDEELAKALLQSIEYSKTITYFDIWGNCKSIFITDIIDLIQRLQAENEELKSPKFASWKIKFYNAKEEIERLTEELDLANETIDRNNKRYEKVSIERQKALDRVDFLEDALLDKIRRNEEIITAIKQAEQQAVKDTAKEIFSDLLKEFSIRKSCGNADVVVREMAQRKGVEVE